MISDKQGQEWVLRKLYDAGWRYYVKNAGGCSFLTTNTPVIFNDRVDIMVGGRIRYAGLIGKVLPSLNENEILDIAEYLGIVDWSKVKVDTPILVRELDGCPWKKRYFAFFDGRIVQAWKYGATSWSIVNKRDTTSWPYAKLAEV
jgi:hypothetical protein